MWPKRRPSRSNDRSRWLDVLTAPAAMRKLHERFVPIAWIGNHRPATRRRRCRETRGLLDPKSSLRTRHTARAKDGERAIDGVTLTDARRNRAPRRGQRNRLRIRSTVMRSHPTWEAASRASPPRHRRRVGVEAPCRQQRRDGRIEAPPVVAQSVADSSRDVREIDADRLRTVAAPASTATSTASPDCSTSSGAGSPGMPTAPLRDPDPDRR